MSALLKPLEGTEEILFCAGTNLPLETHEKSKTKDVLLMVTTASSSFGNQNVITIFSFHVNPIFIITIPRNDILLKGILTKCIFETNVKIKLII